MIKRLFVVMASFLVATAAAAQSYPNRPVKIVVSYPPGGVVDVLARPLAAGQSCGSIRQELNRLDSKGTQAKVEAATQGKKLPPGAQADVDRYNDLLNQYLGARCHV